MNSVQVMNDTANNLFLIAMLPMIASILLMVVGSKRPKLKNDKGFYYVD